MIDFIHKAEDIVVFIEIVEHSGSVHGYLLEGVFFMFFPEL